MLGKVKLALRISNTLLDEEVSDLIDAARQDLILSGILSSKAEDDNDALVKRAVITYCKANFGYDNPDADRFRQSYEMLKQHLSLSVEYTEEVI